MKNLFLIFKNFVLFFNLIINFIKKKFKLLMCSRLFNNFIYYLLGKKVIVNYLIVLNFSLLILWEDFIKLLLDFYFIVEKIIILFFFCFYIIVSYVFFNFFKIFLYCNFYALSLIIPLLICVAYLTLVERKIIGASQRRLGPEFVGLFGLGQPIADV